MRGVNHVIIGGNVGNDPEIRYLPDGRKVLSFSLAISEKWKGRDGEDREQVHWIRVTCYAKLAEICEQYLHKGDGVLVYGGLKSREWEDKNDGSKKRMIEVIGKNVHFLSKKRGEQQETQTYDDDVPF